MTNKKLYAMVGPVMTEAYPYVCQKYDQIINAASEITDSDPDEMKSFALNAGGTSMLMGVVVGELYRLSLKGRISHSEFREITVGQLLDLIFMVQARAKETL